MKRSEAEKEIENLIGDLMVNGYGFASISKAVLRKIDDLGYLPPTCTVKVIPDTSPRGGFKHSETKREYDEE